LDDAFLLLPTSFSKVMQKQQATMVNFAVVALWAPGGGGLRNFYLGWCDQRYGVFNSYELKF
jgi:hypothetical protein